jgi:hypothetical protein
MLTTYVIALRWPSVTPARRWGGWNGRWYGSLSVGGILVRYEKKAVNFLGLLQLACAFIWIRRRARPIGD